jgi:hypothetical protein
MLGPEDATQGGENPSLYTGATCHGARIQLCLEEIDLSNSPSSSIGNEKVDLMMVLSTS